MTKSPTKAEQIWANLPQSQKAALCILTGTPLPLWTHLNYTVASVRALVRKGLWKTSGESGPTPLGKRVLKAVPKYPEIADQLQAIQAL